MRTPRLLSKLAASALVLVFGALPGCGKSTPSGHAAPVVVVRMREFRFDYDKRIHPGRVIFRFVNVGKLPHKVMMIPLSEDFPPIDQQVHGTDRRYVPPFAQIFVRRPGESGTFAIDVVAGQRYGMMSYLTDKDGVSDAVKGMASEFTALPT